MTAKIIHIEFNNREGIQPVGDEPSGLHFESVYRCNNNGNPEIEKIIRLMSKMDNEGQKKVFALVFKKYNEIKIKAAQAGGGDPQPEPNHNTPL